MAITRYVQSLQIPDDEYIVVGGGILTALKLRELHDIDILVSKRIFDLASNNNWHKAGWSGTDGLRKGLFELGTQVRGYTVADLRREVMHIEGIPYLNLELMYCIKQKLRRQNDLRDIQIIDESNISLCRDCLAHAQQIVRQMYPA